MMSKGGLIYSSFLLEINALLNLGRKGREKNVKKERKRKEKCKMYNKWNRKYVYKIIQISQIKNKMYNK